MSPRHFIVATAGHVDHGKSSLVKALTGTDPDRLPEEKARGITIDLGFAHLTLPAPQPTETPFQLGIVDVPGHEDFVKNMVAGVGSVDLALFVVAADDGWMPQTEEHLQILSYLGVERAVVVLTKIDLASNREAQVAGSIREKLRQSVFAEAPLVETSIVDGRGFEELKRILSEVLATTPVPRDYGKPRLPMDRVFTLRGIGTVVTGTLIGGSLRKGQTITIQPSEQTARLRSIQTHNREVECVVPGTRTALNLPDLESAEQAGHSSGGVRRGDVITLAELGSASDTLDVLLEKSERLIGAKTGAGRPLKEGMLIRIHLGSANVPARLRLHGDGGLVAGECRLAQLRLESPLFAFAGDRFIIRDWAQQFTLGGGVVLDPDASRHRFHSDARKQFLEPRSRAPYQIEAYVRSQLRREGVTTKASFLRKSRFSISEISAEILNETKQANALQLGDWVADAGWWQAQRNHCLEVIDAEHRSHPERSGLAINQLRAAVERNLPSPELFTTLLADLCGHECAQTSATIRRKTHRPALPPQLQAPGAKLRADLAAKPLEPLSRKELAATLASQQTLRFLIETGEVTELNPDIVLLTDAYQRAAEAIKQFLREHRTATVSELRQTLGTSRRILVPLLERLDREGITLRQGDQRVLGRKT